ncbi:MAG: dihydrodipicolinate synthase family protein [Chloroflexi bacterium]|nr:dihydrodipicolinate synthase family protein [Chloroflexota bacterium]
MTNGELGGVIVPVVTPLHDDERVDEIAFRKGIRRLIDAGVHAIFVGGSAGEGPLLTDGEWERMVSVAYDEVKGAVNLLGGAMDTSTRRVRARMRILSQIGYPYCVITPTYYITLRHPDEYMRLFGECAEHAQGMDIVAYSIPACTGSFIPADKAIEMARRGWIRYIKESSGDFGYFCRLVIEGAEVGLKVLEGDEPHIAKALLAGAAGIVPVCANYEPHTFVRAYQAACAGDEAELARYQERIMVLRQKLVFAGPNWIAGVKYGVASLGLGSGRPVSPLQPLTEDQKRSIEAIEPWQSEMPERSK